MEDFSDDELDALNINALQELENKAIQSTQGQRSYESHSYIPALATASALSAQPPPIHYDVDQDFEDDDLDDAVVEVHDTIPAKGKFPAQPVHPLVNDRLAQLPSRLAAPQRQQKPWQPVTVSKPVDPQRRQPLASASRSAAPPVPVFPRASQQLQPRSQGAVYSQISRPPPPLPRPAPSTSRYQPSQAQHQIGPTAHEIATLQAQILDLKSKLTTKDGEISIVRRRLEKSREDYERELQIIKAQAAEQLVRQERLVEAAKAAQESAATELQFTRRDLREEIDRSKRQDGSRTPKKKATKAWGVADGFEDVEMARSPSKGQRGRNVGPVASSIVEPPSKLLRTPTKNKRKRPTIESPIMALETHSDDVIMGDEGYATGADFMASAAPIPHRNTPFDYLKVVLNHSAAHGRPLTLECLAGFALPSRPDESLASILLRKLSATGDAGHGIPLPVQFCLEVIRLWDSCRKEGCLEPITDLVSLVLFSLQLQTVALAPHIASPLLTVAMETCYEVAIPIFNSTSGNPREEGFVKFRENIDTTKILSLLYLTALGCATSEPVGGSLLPPAVDFWNQVHIQFVLMLLSRKQPIEDFMVMLKLLWTSVFPDSIGPINPDKTPEVVAQLIIDRISIQLTETSKAGVDETQLWNARLLVLQTLSTFATSRFGLAQLAKHDWLIPRLVTLLSCCVEELYDGDMQCSSATRDEETEQLQMLVMHTMLLLHIIITDPLSGNSMDVSTKLSKTTGGLQKYLLSLSRLNFTDDLVSETTAELAHELLELAVTPEAGVELGEFFSG
ncbi:hypothetical protein GGS20DRAFT_572812 [Poronia punctata]|nr:hypothetical protein GGS20DRAFT_572812 [Poronia punctata]